MGKKMGRKKPKIVLPPELPPEIPDEAVEVSDEDMQFVSENQEYTGFMSNLDTKTINKQVTRVADVKEDELESLYERRLKKKSLVKETEKQGLEVDPVDALPVKTLDGKLHYRTVPKATQKSENEDKDEDNTNNKDAGTDASVVKRTKAEKRAQLKKMRKEAKKQSKEVAAVEDVEQMPQAEVMDEVRKDMTAEEANEKKKFRLAELGTALLTDPELNIKSLKEMLEISKDGDRDIVVLALKSLLAVFRDIIPGREVCKSSWASSSLPVQPFGCFIDLAVALYKLSLLWGIKYRIKVNSLPESYPYGVGTFGGSYPVGAYPGIGYGITSLMPRGPWNNPTMAGIRGSPLPYGNTGVVYPAYMNGGIGAMGMATNGYGGNLGSGISVGDAQGLFCALLCVCVISRALSRGSFGNSLSTSSEVEAYMQKLIAIEKQDVYKRVAVRCICTLLKAVPHFNLRENLLAAVIRNISSEDDISRKLCCATVKSLFTNEGKHGGEATVEAVQMIADLVKTHDCQLHPDSIEVFMSLTFDEDLGKHESQDANNKFKSKNAKRKNLKEQKELAANERKRTRKEMMSKTREEVTAELKAASLATDVTERRRMQTDVLSAVFETYFRVLKHALKPRAVCRPQAFIVLSWMLLCCLDVYGY
ncbi:hypothetical protein BC332_11471 [Capsicum chinense]|nr:hypothetical protein BC332_11471 [Capsicum chinense]